MVLNEKEINNSTSPEAIGDIKKESGEMVDIHGRKKEEKISAEIGGWLKKVEEYNSDTEGMIVRDGSVKMVSPDKISQDAYQIPLTKSNFVSNISKKTKNVGDSISWFVTFLLRIIKLKKGRVTFKEDECK